MKMILALLAIFITSSIYSQNQVLLENNWFVHSARDSNVSNYIIDVTQNTRSELRFEITFLNDKIVLLGCCGGIFEMDVNYLSDNEIEITSLNELETINCNDEFVSIFYDRIKGAFTGLINQNIQFNINLDEVLNFSLVNPLDESFVLLTNAPGEYIDSSTEIYWGHEPPNHQWSLTQVTYQGQTMELPYGAALTVADIYEGTFTIALCGEVFVALNSSWYLDIETYEGPCFISCSILENIAGSCEPVAGYDNTYLETFKQNAFNFLNDNLDVVMEYEFTFGAARKLVIYDFLGNKLIFHSNENYLNTAENKLQAEISIYPNPAKETLHIRQKSNAFDTATMYDVQGKKVNRYALENRLSTIDIKAFTPGLYFLVLESESGKREIQKFVKK